MPKKKAVKSKKVSMKWLQSVTGLRLFKLFSWLLLIGLMKLVIMGTLLFDFSSFEIFNSVDRAVVASRRDGEKKVQPEAAGVGVLATAHAFGGDAEEPDEEEAKKKGMKDAPAVADTPEGATMQRDLLIRKQQDLTQREQALETLMKQVDEKLAKLTEMEAKIQRMLEQANSIQDKKNRHLIDVYSNMKANKAAAVLETLDERIAVKILAGMRGRQAGEILTFVNAKKAARLSEALTKMQIPLK